MRRIFISLLCCVLLLFITFITFISTHVGNSSKISPSRHGSRPLIIALSVSLTGEFDHSGLGVKRGLLLWQKEINNSGGLLGRTIKIITKDDQSNPNNVVQIYNQFIAEHQVDFFIAPFSSEMTSLVAPIAEKAKIPLLALNAISDELWENSYKYLFGMLKTTRNYSGDFMEIMARSGYSKIAIIANDDIFGKSIAEGARGWANSLNIEVVIDERYDRTPQHTTDIAHKVARSGAQGIIIAGHTAMSIVMRRALAEAKTTTFIFLSLSGEMARSRYQETLGELKNNSISSTWWLDKDHGGIESFIFRDKFRSEYKVIATSDAALGYSAGLIFQEATLRANSLSKERIRDAISQLNTITLAGRFGVDNRGRQIKHQMYLYQWQDNKLELVWPVSMATKNIVVR